MEWDMDKAEREYYSACNRNADEWVAANGGSETPFIKNGTRYLYVYNPYQHRWGVYDFSTDIVIDDRIFYGV